MQWRKCLWRKQIELRGANHGEISKDRGEKIPAAIIIGGEPATVFSSIAPVPEGLDKYLFAGITRKEGIKTVKCKTIIRIVTKKKVSTRATPIKVKVQRSS